MSMERELSFSCGGAVSQARRKDSHLFLGPSSRIFGLLARPLSLFVCYICASVSQAFTPLSLSFFLYDISNRSTSFHMRSLPYTLSHTHINAHVIPNYSLLYSSIY